jgi:hypothetical protein
MVHSSRKNAHISGLTAQLDHETQAYKNSLVARLGASEERLADMEKEKRKLEADVVRHKNTVRLRSRTNLYPSSDDQ